MPEQSLARLRDKIMEALGGYCRWPGCGITDRRLLTIDHIHGGGNQERRQVSRYPYYRAMLDRLDEFQLLCWNHNHLKRLTQHEH